MLQAAGNARTNSKHRGRKRRAVGWTLLALGMLIAALWTWSGWWYAWWTPSGHWRFELGSGRAMLWYDQASHARRSWVVTTQPRLEWLWEGAGHYRLAKASVSDVWATPLWPAPLLLWPVGALLLRSGLIARQRAMNELCSHCGYSLAGLTAASACPECGKTANAPPSAT